MIKNIDLVSNFESLGGTGHGCEFGIFQRNYGAEPLSLLRWADVGIENLILALQNTFEGIGSNEYTSVFQPDNSDEWWTTDKRYWMAMRSFVKVKDVSFDKMSHKISIRQNYLREKLVNDLKQSSKIFVYRNMWKNISTAELNQIYQSIRAYGNNVLLYICYCDDLNKAGDVIVKFPGLLIGYVNHFTFSKDDHFIDNIDEIFLKICENAYSIVVSGKANEQEKTFIDYNFLEKIELENNLEQILSDAHKLHENNDFYNEEKLLLLAKEQFPNHSLPLIKLGMYSHIQKDFSTALERWEILRNFFPNEIVGYTFCALDLKYLGNFTEADKMLQIAMDRFPGSPTPFKDYALIPYERHDWSESLPRWADYRTKFPEDLDGYLWGALAAYHNNDKLLADILVSEAAIRFPRQKSVLIDYARMALLLQNWEDAKIRSEILRQHFPDALEGYTIGITALSNLEDKSGVDSLRNFVKESSINSRRLIIDDAYEALREKNWKLAGERFANIRTNFSDEVSGWVGDIKINCGQGNFKQASNVFFEALLYFPENIYLELAYAELLIQQEVNNKQNWNDALNGIRKFSEKYPSFEDGYIVLIDGLTMFDFTSEAIQVANKSNVLFPKSYEIAKKCCNLAFITNNLEESLTRYKKTRENYMGYIDPYIGIIDSLIHLNLFDDAETEISAAIQKFPNEIRLYERSAQLSNLRMNYLEEYRIWNIAFNKFPNISWIQQRLYESTLNIVDEKSSNNEVVPRKNIVLDDISEILSDFESLGGTHLGCEFGLVQRAAGIEPLGLLRWSDMTYEQLISALDVSFEGVGKVENTELIIPDENSEQEYTTRDRRFNMRMHTFVSRKSILPKLMLVRVCKRLNYLKDKLVNDLNSAEKIFVFKQTTRNLEDNEILKLYLSLRNFSKNTLLYVRYSDSNNHNGSVKIVLDGLIIGYVDKFAMGPNEENNPPQTDSWNEICRKTHKIWKDEVYNK